jgi:hypothetical protein
LAERNAWKEEKRSILTAALNNLITLNIDNELMVGAYVEVEQACRNNPGSDRPMGQNDMWIAATALVAGLPLITTDTDFDHLNGRLLRVHWLIRVLEDQNEDDSKHKLPLRRLGLRFMWTQSLLGYTALALSCLQGGSECAVFLLS